MNTPQAYLGVHLIQELLASSAGLAEVALLQDVRVQLRGEEALPEEQLHVVQDLIRAVAPGRLRSHAEYRGVLCVLDSRRLRYKDPRYCAVFPKFVPCLSVVDTRQSGGDAMRCSWENWGA